MRVEAAGQLARALPIAAARPMAGAAGNAQIASRAAVSFGAAVPAESVAALVAAAAPPAAMQRRNLITRAGTTLDRLERLHRIALAGALDPSVLGELDDLGEPDDPALAALCAEIALRLQVERAKAERL